MINIKNKKCSNANCSKIPSYNLPSENKPIYCKDHKTPEMINILKKYCQSTKCKELAIFGLINKKPHFCLKHKKINMINLVLENKCSTLDCDEEYTQILDTTKYCDKHIPENSLINIKRLCKYCDIKDESTHICKDCKKIQNRKEWAIVRYLKRAIDTQFEYNSSKMLQGCSKKRPDIYFELNKHCIIVEIDENQHHNYEDSCECARINEIVSGIGGHSVIIIRYNPDIVKNNGKVVNINKSDRINLLVKTIKDELVKEYNTFIVKIIQIYYNDNYEVYQPIKEEDITNIVAI
jgi:very-short-patch-repair endonuclease